MGLNVLLLCGGVDADREMVDEFVAFTVAIFTFKHTDTTGERAGDYPNVAIKDPKNVAFGFTVTPRHVPDLGVRADIFLADQEACVDRGVLGEDLVDDGDCRIVG